MMLNSILFKARDSTAIDEYRLVEFFLKAWIDQTCDQEVQYTGCDKTLHVLFEKQEDALALRLRGLPSEFRDYLEIVG